MIKLRPSAAGLVHAKTLVQIHSIRAEMAVFDGVHYSLSHSLSPTRRNELAAVLDLNGATSHPPHTHLIALPASHGHTNATRDPNLKLITDRWVDRSVVMGKRQPEQYYSPDPAMIFSGVVACATDLAASDLEVLSAGVTALGGQWRMGLTRDVTHLFALRPESDKYNTALHFASQTHMYILTPHWFDDAVRLARRISEVPYAWPDPPILRPGMTLDLNDEPLTTDGRRKRKPVGDMVGDPVDGIPNEVERARVWAGRRILLSTSLELGGGSRDAIKAGIQRAGGFVVPAADNADEDAEEKVVDECDVFITRWRSGKAYFKAARASILIGTLSWLFSVESSGTLHSPLDSLLWYPTPRGGIPGLIDCEISITNYTGAARDYLKRLIVLVGAKFTPSMSQSNKVLIAGFQPSPKTTRALSWSIPVVNHTWLEDCFVEWRALTVGLERYIVYPPGIDFGKMLVTRQDGPLPSSQSSSIPRSAGGAVPGGRGVNIIDVGEEETRDAEYRERTGKPENATNSLTIQKADAGDSTVDVIQPVDLPSESRWRPRSRAELVNKTPSLSERLVSMSTPLTTSAAGFPPDNDDAHKEVGEDQPTRVAGKQRGRASSHTTSQGVPRPASPEGSSKVEKGKNRETGQEKDDVGTRPQEDVFESARLSKSKSRLVKRRADDQSAQDDIGVLRRTKASKATRRPDKGDSDSYLDAGEASDVSIPPRRTTTVGSMTPVKSGMKPRPRSKARSTGGGSEDEGWIGLSNSEVVTRADLRKPPETSKPLGNNATIKAREKKNYNDPTNETDEVEPRGSDKNSHRPKRRLSVLVPSVPDDYFSSQSLRNTADIEDKDERERDGRNKGNVASVKQATRPKLVPEGSMHAVSAEASSSVNKRGKPSPAKVSVTLPRGKAKVATCKEESKSRTNKNDAEANRVEDSDVSLIVGDTPISRGGPRRSAANKATTRLKEQIMPDVISFEKEQKQAKRRRSTGGESIASARGERGERIPTVKKRIMLGSSTDINQDAEEDEEAEVEDVVLVSSVKAKSKTVDGKGKAKRTAVAVSDDETDVRELPAKKKPRGPQEKTERQKTAVRLITTGLSLSDDVIKRLTKLGVQMTTKPTDCTHLIAKGIVRTEKFLCAMSVSPYILTAEWTNVSAKSGKLLPESDYLLSDGAAEKKWAFKLADAMVRAKGPEGGSNLFKEMTFYLTPKIPLDIKLLKNVVSAGGGQVQTTTTPTVRILKGKTNRYVVSCEEDKAIWQPLAQDGFKIYSTELLLRAALAQKIEWDRPESLVAG